MEKSLDVGTNMLSHCSFFKWVGGDPVIGGTWTWASKLGLDPNPAQLLEMVEWDLHPSLWRKAAQ